MHALYGIPTSTSSCYQMHNSHTLVEDLAKILYPNLVLLRRLFPMGKGNKSANLKLVYGPPTITCMIMTNVSQPLHWFPQLPTMCKGFV